MGLVLEDRAFGTGRESDPLTDELGRFTDPGARNPEEGVTRVSVAVHIGHRSAQCPRQWGRFHVGQPVPPAGGRHPVDGRIGRADHRPHSRIASLVGVGNRGRPGHRFARGRAGRRTGPGCGSDGDLHGARQRRRPSAQLSGRGRLGQSAAAVQLSVRHGAPHRSRFRCPSTPADVGPPRAELRPALRGPDRGDSVLPRSASRRKYHLHRCPRRRSRERRGERTADLLCVTAHGGSRLAGDAEVGGCLDRDRAGCRRHQTRRCFGRRRRRSLGCRRTRRPRRSDPAGSVPDEFPRDVVRERRRTLPTRRGHAGRGPGIRRPPHHGSVLVQGDRRRRPDHLRSGPRASSTRCRHRRPPCAAPTHPGRRPPNRPDVLGVSHQTCPHRQCRRPRHSRQRDRVDVGHA